MIHLLRLIDRHKRKFRFAAVLIIIAALFVLGWQGGEDYVTNIYTELLGVVVSAGVTVVIVDSAYERQARIRLQRDLVNDAGSRSNDIAMHAIDRLRQNGWLTGSRGALRSADLRSANLQTVDMRLDDAGFPGDPSIIKRLGFKTLAKRHGTNLENAQLFRANLRRANLFFASLEKAILIQTDLTKVEAMLANLESASLFAAVMVEADFSRANLKNADLSRANLRGADLSYADLRGALMKSYHAPNSSSREGSSGDLSEGLEQFVHQLSIEMIRVLETAGQNAPENPLGWGADLRGANLQGAQLHDAIMDDVLLPDGTRYSSEMGADELLRFTDENHSDYDKTRDSINEFRRSVGLAELGGSSLS